VTDALRPLLRLAACATQDTPLASAAVAAVSVKEPGDTILMSVDGVGPDTINKTSGWVRLNLSALRVLIDRTDLQRMASQRRERLLPEAILDALVAPLSEESSPPANVLVHALLQRYVIHVSSPLINAVACATNPGQAIRKLFGDLDPPMLYLDYAHPGYPLALAVRQTMADFTGRNHTRPKVLLCRGHGLFVGANSLRQTLALTRNIRARLRRSLAKAAAFRKAPRLSMLAKADRDAAITEIALLLRRRAAQGEENRAFVRFSDSPPLTRFVSSSHVAMFVRSGQLTSDAVLRCLPRVAWLGTQSVKAAASGKSAPALKALKAFRRTRGYAPRIVVAYGLGAFAVAEDLSRASDAMSAYETAVLTLEGTLSFGGPAFLNARQTRYLNAARSTSPSTARTPSRPLAGMIALVTGAGSGLGRGIAIGLARAAAAVILLDIDPDSANETYRIIADKTDAPALPVTADVTNEDSVARAFRDAVRWAGGLDILVNAAGIAPAFALHDFPLDLWRKTLEINLTGYFLAAREATRIFTKQQLGGNIINLSSKTGLEASVNNTAYNATKSAEIHLARGWARELGPQGIRVNAVAPGNVFKGSKIWNPAYIRQCARKRGIKPEEVIPYYVNLTALKQEIEPRDVADSVVFLCSDAARRITGQTLVCDAGQVPVR